MPSAYGAASPTTELCGKLRRSVGKAAGVGRGPSQPALLLHSSISCTTPHRQSMLWNRPCTGTRSLLVHSLFGTSMLVHILPPYFYAVQASPPLLGQAPPGGLACAGYCKCHLASVAGPGRGPALLGRKLLVGAACWRLCPSKRPHFQSLFEFVRVCWAANSFGHTLPVQQPPWQSTGRGYRGRGPRTGGPCP